MCIRDSAEIEADAAPVGTAVLADLVPDDVALVFEAPGRKHPQAFGEERVGHPQVEVCGIFDDRGYGQRQNVVQRHRRVAVQMCIRDRAGGMHKLNAKPG